MKRVLIPVKKNDDVSPMIAYVVRCRAAGKKVAVVVLHVETSIPPSSESSKNNRNLTVSIPSNCMAFSNATEMLEGLDIEFATCMRNGETVFTILDVAEEIDCHEIVISAPSLSLLKIMTRKVSFQLLQNQRGIPVVSVDKKGMIAR